MSEFNNVQHIETARNNEALTGAEIDKRLIDLHAQSFENHGASALHVDISEDLAYELLPYGLDWSETGRSWAYKLKVFSRVSNGFALEEFETHRHRRPDGLGLYMKIDANTRERTNVSEADAKEIDNIYKQIVSSLDYREYLNECSVNAELKVEKKANRLHRKIGRAVSNLFS